MTFATANLRFSDALIAFLEKATALGGNISAAQQGAYEAAKRIHWDGVFWRSDIGYRAVARES